MPLVTYVSDVTTAMTEAKGRVGDKNVQARAAGRPAHPQAPPPVRLDAGRGAAPAALAAVSGQTAAVITGQPPLRGGVPGRRRVASAVDDFPIILEPNLMRALLGVIATLHAPRSHERSGAEAESEVETPELDETQKHHARCLGPRSA